MEACIDNVYTQLQISVQIHGMHDNAESFGGIHAIKLNANSIVTVVK